MRKLVVCILLAATSFVVTMERYTVRAEVLPPGCNASQPFNSGTGWQGWTKCVSPVTNTWQWQDRISCYQYGYVTFQYGPWIHTNNNYSHAYCPTGAVATYNEGLVIRYP